MRALFLDGSDVIESRCQLPLHPYLLAPKRDFPGTQLDVLIL
jgi:hypothetical protein